MVESSSSPAMVPVRTVTTILLVLLLPILVVSLIVGCGGGGGGGDAPAPTALSTSPADPPAVTLTWETPTSATDGTAFPNLAGYYIYYGTSSGVYTQVIDAGNVTSYSVNGLAQGTYYFAVAAHDAAGNETDFSNEVVKIVQ